MLEQIAADEVVSTFEAMGLHVPPDGGGEVGRAPPSTRPPEDAVDSPSELTHIRRNSSGGELALPYIRRQLEQELREQAKTLSYPPQEPPPEKKKNLNRS